MKDARFWIVILALVSFLAGGAAGALVARERFAPAPPRGPFADYESLINGHFDLDVERRRILRGLLQNYQEDLERIRDRHTAQLLSAMEPELRDKGLRYRNILRDELLPESDRAEFDRLVREHVVRL